ncbi:hypothetical protein [Streptomyces sp. NPDC002758]
MREQRAARRMSTATVGRLRIYSDDGETLLAELGPAEEGGGGLQTFGNLGLDKIPISASLTSGELRYQPADDFLSEVPARTSYDVTPDTGSDLQMSSGAIGSSDWAAVVDLLSVVGGVAPTVLVNGFRLVDGVGESGPCNMDIAGSLTAANIAYGTVSITPITANTPVSAAINGLNVLGTTFTAFTSPVTSRPGSTGTPDGVTGTSANNVSGGGLTVWLNRQNLTTTGVNWMVIGQ